MAGLSDHCQAVSRGGSANLEHRWGTRCAVNVPVRLDARPQALSFGRLRNASASGTFVETGLRPPLWTRVIVELAWGQWRRSEPQRVAAYIVRHDENGCGLEWCEFAPEPVLALMLAARRAAPARTVPAPGHAVPAPGHAIPVPAHSVHVPAHAVPVPALVAPVPALVAPIPILRVPAWRPHLNPSAF